MGQRPARRKCYPRHDADAGCRNPISGGHSNRSLEVHPWLWKLPKNLSGRASRPVPGTAIRVPLAACWRWRAVPFTGVLPCWQPRAHCAPGRASLPLPAWNRWSALPLPVCRSAACAPVRRAHRAALRRKMCRCSGGRRPPCCCWAPALAAQRKALPGPPRPARWCSSFCPALPGLRCWTRTV